MYIRGLFVAIANEAGDVRSLICPTSPSQILARTSGAAVMFLSALVYALEASRL